MKSTYSIKQYSSDSKGRVRYIRYNIHHRGADFGLEQDLKLYCDKHGKWTAYMAMPGMTGKSSPQEALLRLAKWLEYMAVAITDLNEKLEVGLVNPIGANKSRLNDDKVFESFRYTLDGLLKKLSNSIEPLDPIEE